MKVKVGNLIGEALDWVVTVIVLDRCIAQGSHVKGWVAQGIREGHRHDPYSTDWLWGGPILSEARISRTIDHSGLWIAYDGFNYADSKEHMQCDISELVAGLRCFVSKALGEEVDVPEELL